MKLSRILPALVLGAGALCAPQALGQSATDREKIVDVAELRAVMDRATSGIRSHLDESTLPEKFHNVAELLQRPDVDKGELVGALRDLKGEMDAFTRNWESEVAGPLWDGQEAVAGTIDRVRLMLARSASVGKPSSRVRAKLDHFDKRLAGLARAIKAETNELRQQRLKTVFANVLALRKLIEDFPIDLGPASQAVHVKLIQALTSLENQLLAATFQIERARVILDQESEFVGMYVGVLEGVIEAEALLGMMDDMRSEGVGLGQMVADLGQLTSHVENFAAATEGFLSHTADSLQLETDKIAEETDVAELLGVDIDEALDFYANQPTKVPAGR